MDFLLAYAAINALALCAPMGARIGIGFEMDEYRRRQLTSVALMLTLGAAILVCLAPGLAGAALLAGLASLLLLVARLRFRLHVARPGAGALSQLCAPLRAMIIAQWLYGLGGALLCRYIAPDAIWGYVAGLIALACMGLGFREPKPKRAARCTLLTAGVTLLAACAALFALPAAQYLIGLPLIACALGFVLLRAARKLPGLLPAAAMIPALRLPGPFPALASVALLLAFVLFSASALYEAFLPLRAMFIRARARRN